MEAATRRPHRALVAALLVATLCYWVFMFVATHLRANQLPGGVPPSLDKVEHLAGFAALAVLLCVAGTVLGFPSGWMCAAVLGLIALYGMADEWTQSFVPTRKPDWRDWLANMSGAVAGVSLFLVLRVAASLMGRTTQRAAGAE